MVFSTFVKLSTWGLLSLSLTARVNSYGIEVDHGLSSNATLSGRNSNVGGGDLSKRVTSGSMTWYDVEETHQQVACGGFYKNGDAILALSLQILDKAKHCGKGVLIYYGGKTAYGTVVDGCEACDPDHIDVTKSLFAQLTTPGLVQVEWEFADAAPAPAPPATTPQPATSTDAPAPATPTTKPVTVPTLAPSPTSSSCALVPTSSTLSQPKTCQHGRARQRKRAAVRRSEEEM